MYVPEDIAVQTVMVVVLSMVSLPIDAKGQSIGALLPPSGVDHVLPCFAHSGWTTMASEALYTHCVSTPWLQQPTTPTDEQPSPKVPICWLHACCSPAIAEGGATTSVHRSVPRVQENVAVPEPPLLLPPASPLEPPVPLPLEHASAVAAEATSTQIIPWRIIIA